jgi:hypothetical protein
VADPGLEDRLLAMGSLAPVATNTDAARAGSRLESAGDFRWDGDPSHSANAVLEQRLQIEPGHSYLLEFDFARPDDTSGVLQIKGRHFFREYGLPEHGGPKSFGAGGEHSKVLPVWTTAGPEALTVTFYPAQGGAGGQPEPPVGQARLLSYDRDSLPVRVDSWIPYRARVRSPAAAWLETPRAFQTGYEARVDGKPAAVLESPDALVAVAVPQGPCSVELAYMAPSELRCLFWVSLLAIAAAAALGLVQSILHLRRALSPAKASNPSL